MADRDAGGEVSPSRRRPSANFDQRGSFDYNLVEGTAGIVPNGKPPDAVTIKKVVVGSWAEQCGVKAGDEILAVNGVGVPDLDPDAFHVHMKNRPLTLELRHQQDSNDVEPTEDALKARAEEAAAADAAWKLRKQEEEAAASAAKKHEEEAAAQKRREQEAAAAEEARKLREKEKEAAAVAATRNEEQLLAQKRREEEAAAAEEAQKSREKEKETAAAAATRNEERVAAQKRREEETPAAEAAQIIREKEKESAAAAAKKNEEEAVAKKAKDEEEAVMEAARKLREKEAEEADTSAAQKDERETKSLPANLHRPPCPKETTRSGRKTMLPLIFFTMLLVVVLVFYDNCSAAKLDPNQSIGPLNMKEYECRASSYPGQVFKVGKSFAMFGVTGVALWIVSGSGYGGLLWCLVSAALMAQKLHGMCYDASRVPPCFIGVDPPQTPAEWAALFGRPFEAIADYLAS